jgi:hypothetical protein
MRRSDLTTEAATMQQRLRTCMGVALAASILLATAGVAGANHYPPVPAGVERKDRAVLNAMHRLSYADRFEMSLGVGECNCFEPTCDSGHFLLSCGGEVYPENAGALSAVRRTAHDTCFVCACAWDVATVYATPVCIGF